MASVIEKLRPLRKDLYDPLDLNRLASFTVLILQDQHIPTTIENVVVAAHRLFPDKFSLIGYPEFPDSARVNRALLQLGPKYRNWARGTVRQGFVLTETGTRVAQEVKAILEGRRTTPEISRQKRKAPIPRTVDITAEIDRLEASALMASWKAGRLSGTTDLEFIDMLGAFAYTPPKALDRRLKLLRSTAEQAYRQDVVRFLDDVRGRFRHMLKG